MSTIAAHHSAQPRPFVQPWQRITRAAEQVFDTPAGALASARRWAWLVEARNAAIVVMREQLAMPWASIGRRLDRNGDTVYHGYQAARRRMQADPAYAAAIARVAEVAEV